METKTIYNNNYTLNMVKTAKFKTNKVQLSFKNSLTEETVAQRAIIPYLLKAVSKKYNSREKMSAYLENMYAASFNVSVSKIAKTHGVNFDLNFINDQYTLAHETLFSDALLFLKEVLLNPLFTEEIFFEELRLLKEYFSGLYANKLKYAINRLNNVMFKDDVYRLSALGEDKLLEHLTLESCISEYEKMLHNDMITITVVGDIVFDDIQKAIEKTFNFKARQQKLTLIDNDYKRPIEVNEVIETLDVKQAKLVIGYRLNVFYETTDYLKAILFNTVFGGSGESLLFKEIRDELGLVYFINSSYDPYKGVLFIVSGIAKKDYQKVLKTIDNITTKIIKQEYSDHLLEISKTLQINGLIESLDSISGLAARINRDSLFKKNFDPDSLITKISKITKDDLTLVAKKLVRDTIFFLKDDNNE